MKLNQVLSIWNKRISWWNEDKSSLELLYTKLLHFVKFGEGTSYLKELNDQSYLNILFQNYHM